MPSPEPLDLEPIKAREAAARPGPWRWEPEGKRDGEMRYTMPNDQGSAAVICEGWDPEAEASAVYIALADCEFIREARSDVPALIAEVESLRSTNENLMLALEQITEHMVDRRGAYEELRRALHEERSRAYRDRN